MDLNKPQIKITLTEGTTYQVEVVKFRFLRATPDGEMVHEKIGPKVVFEGSISECESYVNMLKSGYL